MSRRLPTAAGWALALLVAAGFCGLGVWQLDRARHKQALLDQVRRVLAQRQPQALAAAADPARAARFEWSGGRGHFTDAPAVLLDNQIREGRPGVRVYRVFQPGAGAALLVELGWLPLPADRRLPAVPRPAATQVSGLLAPPPAAGLGGAAPPARQADGSLLVLGLQPPAVAAALGSGPLAPRVLKLDPALPLGYPRDLQVLPNTLPPQRHLGYAVQWFGLALAVLATAAVLTRRRRRAGREKMVG